MFFLSLFLSCQKTHIHQVLKDIPEIQGENYYVPLPISNAHHLGKQPHQKPEPKSTEITLQPYSCLMVESDETNLPYEYKVRYNNADQFVAQVSPNIPTELLTSIKSSYVADLHLSGLTILSGTAAPLPNGPCSDLNIDQELDIITEALRFDRVQLKFHSKIEANIGVKLEEILMSTGAQSQVSWTEVEEGLYELEDVTAGVFLQKLYLSARNVQYSIDLRKGPKSFDLPNMINGTFTLKNFNKEKNIATLFISPEGQFNTVEGNCNLNEDVELTLGAACQFHLPEALKFLVVRFRDSKDRRNIVDIEVKVFSTNSNPPTHPQTKPANTTLFTTEEGDKKWICEEPFVNADGDIYKNGCECTPRPEICNGKDDNCDGVIDEDGEKLIFLYPDADQDKYGDPNKGVPFCYNLKQDILDEGYYIEDNRDCNDNEQQNSCGAKWYKDNDGDGFGNNQDVVVAIEPPPGYTKYNEDCDDGNSNIYPTRTELCNFIDDNCNGEIDEGLPHRLYYYDADKDGFGRNDAPQSKCKAPPYHVAKGGDCDDNNKLVVPQQHLFFDNAGKKVGFDFNCNGVEEKKWTTKGKCSGGKAIPQGWYHHVPKCGEEAEWLHDCDRKIFGVVKEREPKRQKCR